jgi:hypothetical protein
MATLLRSVVVLALILGTFAATPVQAADLVPCGNVITVNTAGTECPSGDCICYSGECSICDTQTLAFTVLNYLITLGVIIAALLFVNAGVLYVTSPGNSGNIAKAHRIFTSTLVGLIIMLAAWLLIDLIMKALFSEGEMIGAQKVGPWNNFLCEGAAANGAYCVDKIKGMQIKGGTAPPPGPPPPPPGTPPGGPGGPTKCPVAGPASGCSPERLAPYFGRYASHASSICAAETSGGHNIPSTCDVCSNLTRLPFSFGYFQINIAANYLDTPTGRLNCPDAISAHSRRARGSACGYVYTCVLKDADLYNRCRTAAMTPEINFQNAFRLSSGGTYWYKWSTARTDLPYESPKCGVRPLP